MAKITFSLDITDAEQANFLARFAERATVAGSEGGEEDESGPAALVVPGEVDSDGVPWSADWHSSKKTKTEAGKWRLGKGKNAAEYAAAVPTLKASITTPPAAAITGLTAGVPATAPAGLPGFPAPMGLPTMPVSAPVPAPISYEEVVAKYQELANSGKVTGENITAIYAAAGVGDPAELMTNETLRRKLFDHLSTL